MWSEDIRKSLYEGLEKELNNKTFYNASEYYKSTSKQTFSTSKSDNTAHVGYLSFEDSTSSPTTFIPSVRGISFSNKIESDQSSTFTISTTGDSMKIYKISDLLSSNVAQMTIIPLSTIPKNLSLVKRFEWKDVLFSDVGTAFHMIKDRFFK